MMADDNDNISMTAGTSNTPLHPEAVSFLRMRQKAGVRQLPEIGVQKAREAAKARNKLFAGTYDFAGSITNVKIPNGEGTGADGVGLRVYRPASLRKDPAILVWFHGGGHVLGSLDTHDTCCRTLADCCEVIIVSVEYRLAPEHKLPAGLEDCDAATRWVMEHRTTVGGSASSPVGVGGDSAGGQAAALTCHYVSGISFQVLVYGCHDERMIYPSYTEFQNGPVISQQVAKWFKEQRLPNVEESQNNPRFNPMLQPRFDHLPPAIIIAAQCDPLRDLSYAYLEKLQQAGVQAELHLIKGAIHGFFAFPGHFKDCCTEAYTKVATFIKRTVYNP